MCCARLWAELCLLGGAYKRGVPLAASRREVLLRSALQL